MDRLTIVDSISQLRPFHLPFTPLEWFGLWIVSGNERLDDLAQFGDILETSSAQRLSREDVAPDFDLVEPTAEVGVKWKGTLGCNANIYPESTRFAEIFHPGQIPLGSRDSIWLAVRAK